MPTGPFAAKWRFTKLLVFRGQSAGTGRWNGSPLRICPISRQKIDRYYPRAPRHRRDPEGGALPQRQLKCGLLVIDEVGFRPLDRMEVNLFLRLVSTRYERGAILLTSNRHVRDWGEFFAGDEILTPAILYRLLHHVAVIHIDGRSCRLRELAAQVSTTRQGPRADSPRSN